MSAPRFASVDDYLDSLDAVKAATMRDIIETIITEFPETDAVIAWNVPQIKLGKAYVFGLSASRNHLSLNPWSAEVLDAFRARLETSYVVLKSTVQIPVDWEVDRDLLKDLVRARIAELNAG